MKLKLLKSKTPNMVCACVHARVRGCVQAESQDDLQLNTLKGTAASQRFKPGNKEIKQSGKPALEAHPLTF